MLATFPAEMTSWLSYALSSSLSKLTRAQKTMCDLHSVNSPGRISKILSTYMPSHVASLQHQNAFEDSSMRRLASFMQIAGL